MEMGVHRKECLATINCLSLDLGMEPYDISSIHVGMSIGGDIM